MSSRQPYNEVDHGATGNRCLSEGDDLSNTIVEYVDSQCNLEDAPNILTITYAAIKNHINR
jgi:hypothetical protein